MLADLTINGRPRKVIMQANKNAFYYVLDRITGQFISAGAVLAGDVGQGDRSEDRPADGEPGGVLRHRADSDHAGRRRRAQLVADVVQSGGRADLHSDLDQQQLDLRGGNQVRSAAGPDDRHRAADADRRPGRRRRRLAPSRSKDRADEARWWRGIRWRSRCAGGSRAAAASAAAPDDGRQPGVPDRQRRPSDRLQRRQAARSCWSSRPACAAAWGRRSPIGWTASSTWR